MKLWEQLAAAPGTGGALVVLCAAMPEPRGGGDFDLEDNWHGPERDQDGAHGCTCTPGPMPADYPSIAKRTIGRWAGDRVALVGDYAKDSDLPGSVAACGVGASKIYGLCGGSENPANDWTDVTDDVCAVIEHELGGKFIGDGWRDWADADALKTQPKCQRCGVYVCRRHPSFTGPYRCEVCERAPLKVGVIDVRY